MIAKVAHLVRIIGQETELDCFVKAVRAEYHELITTRISRGEVLWAQFEAAVEACQADPKDDDCQITEKVNEMAAAKVLLDDQAITWPITYEPDLLPDGRKIVFVVDQVRSGTRELSEEDFCFLLKAEGSPPIGSHVACSMLATLSRKGTGFRCHNSKMLAHSAR